MSKEARQFLDKLNQVAAALDDRLQPAWVSFVNAEYDTTVSGNTPEERQKERTKLKIQAIDQLLELCDLVDQSFTGFNLIDYFPHTLYSRLPVDDMYKSPIYKNVIDPLVSAVYKWGRAVTEDMSYILRDNNFARSNLNDYRTALLNGEYISGNHRLYKSVETARWKWLKWILEQLRASARRWTEVISAGETLLSIPEYMDDRLFYRKG